MPTLSEAGCNAQDRQLLAREDQKVEAELIAHGAPLPNPSHRAQAGQDGFQGETLPARHATLDLAQHQETGLECRCFLGPSVGDP